MTFKGNKYQQYIESTNSTCCVCSLPIHDQTTFRVNDLYFHSLCLNCSECRIKISDKCYADNGNIYCKEDFFKKFGTKCSSCGYNIPPSDIVRYANDFVYHMECFTCLICHRKLHTGDEFYLINDQKLVCKNDYDTLKNKEIDEINKRPRTTITQNQLDILKQTYNRSSKPARYIRESLAIETGLDMRVVQVWFQNRRAKEKRLKGNSKKRNKTQNIHQEEDQTSNECDTDISYDESDSDNPSPQYILEHIVQHPMNSHYAVSNEIHKQ